MEQNGMTREDYLDKLAQEYYDRCEVWDRYNLSGPTTIDGRQPATPEELVACNKYANSVMRNVLWRCEEDGDGLRRAMKRVLLRR